MEKHTGGEVRDLSCIIYLISFESVSPIIRSKNIVCNWDICGIVLYMAYLPSDFRVTQSSQYLRAFVSVNHDNYITENRPEHQELYALHLANSVWVLFCPTEYIKHIEGLSDRVYFMTSLFEKTRQFKHLQMPLQRRHFLLSNLKTPSVGPPGVLNLQPATPVSGYCRYKLHFL